MYKCTFGYYLIILIRSVLRNSLHSLQHVHTHPLLNTYFGFLYEYILHKFTNIMKYLFLIIIVVYDLFKILLISSNISKVHNITWKKSKDEQNNISNICNIIGTNFGRGSRNNNLKSMSASRSCLSNRRNKKLSPFLTAWRIILWFISTSKLLY